MVIWLQDGQNKLYKVFKFVNNVHQELCWQEPHTLSTRRLQLQFPVSSKLIDLNLKIIRDNIIVITGLEQ